MLRRAVDAASASLACLALLTIPVAAQQAPGPGRPAVEIPPIPGVSEFELENGLRVIVGTDTTVASVTMRLSVLGGSLFDPAGKSGTAALAAALLARGTATRTADDLMDALVRVGARFRAESDADFLHVIADVPRRDLEFGLDLLSDVVLRPSFPDPELERLRADLAGDAERAIDDASRLALRRLMAGLYGEHPYGQSPTRESLDAVTRSDLLEYHRARVRPAQAVLVIGGALDSAEAHRVVQQVFGGWGGRGAPMAPARPAPQRARSEILLIDRPEAESAVVALGSTTWFPTDTRAYAARVVDQLFVRGDDSRLQRALGSRGDEPFGVGTTARIGWTRGIGYYVLEAETPIEAADSVLARTLDAMRRLGADPVSYVELVVAQQAVARQMGDEHSSPVELAEHVGFARRLGLATDYVQGFAQRILGLNPVQVQSAARGLLRPDAVLLVVVGPAAELRARLEAIAPVTLIDAQGVPVVHVATGRESRTRRLDPLLMREASDSFAVLVQGQAFGYQTVEVRRSADGWSFDERSVLGPIIQQQTHVEMTFGLEMLSTEQTGRFQGNDLRLSVRYAGGRASGEGVTPGAGAMRPVRYTDIYTPSGVVDDNALLALLPTVEWTPGAELTLPVFASGRGVVEERSFRVVAEEAVSVPLGTFAAFRVAYEGGEAPGTYWIESRAPYRVLKFGPSGVPLEFVRVR